MTYVSPNPEVVAPTTKSTHHVSVSVPCPFRTTVTLTEALHLRDAIRSLKAIGMHCKAKETEAGWGGNILFIIRGEPAALEWINEWKREFDKVGESAPVDGAAEPSPPLWWD